MSALLNTELSHGTAEVRDLDATQRFFEDFLGLTVIRPLPMALYASAGGYWQLVCVRSGMKLKPQDENNRFCLHVADEAAVRAAHDAALRDKAVNEIPENRPVKVEQGALSFILQDRDNIWWEITARPVKVLGNLAEAA